jgi:hypothetical protein
VPTLVLPSPPASKPLLPVPPPVPSLGSSARLSHPIASATITNGKPLSQAIAKPSQFEV